MIYKHIQHAVEIVFHVPNVVLSIFPDTFPVVRSKWAVLCMCAFHGQDT